MTSIYIIAEIGVNWVIGNNPDENFATAKKLIDAAKNAGADAAKFQSFLADNLASPSAQKADYQKRNDGGDETQHAMLKRLELPRNWHAPLKEYCEQIGIDFLSSTFDPADSIFLAQDLKCPTIKIGSGELSNAPTLLQTAREGVNIILSTGMASLAEIRSALGVVAFGYTTPNEKPSRQNFAAAYESPAGQKALREKLTLLQCTSEYPCPPEFINLRAIQTLQNEFGLQTGFSDHSATTHIPAAACALGAVMIEKHFTLDKNLPGPDHKASLEPDELTEMIRLIRARPTLDELSATHPDLAMALGTGEKTVQAPESHTREIVGKFVVAARPIKKGDPFTEQNLTTTRTGIRGIEPIDMWDKLINHPANQDYPAGALIQEK